MHDGDDGDEPEARIGRVIAGKYRLVQLLGTGGMGAVYEAENTWTHRRVALKILRSEMASNTNTVSRFLQEARAASAIRHANIVDVFDAGREEGDGALFIVQEFLEGSDLRARLNDARTLQPDEAVRIIAPILNALEAAHARGIVHRDVKPENIFLSRSAEGALVPKLIDFGISKMIRIEPSVATHKTRTGSTIGTPAYMSPEQARGDVKIDERTDLWSVGVVLYEMLCGRCPYDGSTFALLFVQVITEEVPRIETFAPGLPRDLVGVVHHALERERENRYANAESFRNALLACSTDAVVAAPASPRHSLVHGATQPAAVPENTLPAVMSAPIDTPSEATVARTVAPPSLAPTPARRRQIGAAALISVAALGAVTLWFVDRSERPSTLAITRESPSPNRRAIPAATSPDHAVVAALAEETPANELSAPDASLGLGGDGAPDASPPANISARVPAARDAGRVARVRPLRASLDAGASNAQPAGAPSHLAPTGEVAPGDALRPTTAYPGSGVH